MTLYDLIIRNGTLVTAEGVTTDDIAIADQQIAATGPALDGTSQAEIDATGLPSGIALTVSRLPGVAAVQTMQHRFAYVGNDLQDLYGIDPATIGTATTMSDAFFAGGNAQGVLSTLASLDDQSIAPPG